MMSVRQMYSTRRAKKMSSNVTLAATRRAEKGVVEKYEKIPKAPGDPFLVP